MGGWQYVHIQQTPAELVGGPGIRAKHIRIIAGSSLMLLAGLEANSFILFFRQMPLLLPMACYLDCCWYICRCCFSHLLSGAFFLACAKHHHIVEYEML